MTETLERTMTIPEKTQERIWSDIQNFGSCWTEMKEAERTGNTENDGQYSEYVKTYRTKIDTTRYCLRECGILTREQSEAVNFARIWCSIDIEKAIQFLKNAGFTIELKKYF